MCRMLNPAAVKQVLPPLLLTLATLTAGCALSPQVVEIRPEIAVTPRDDAPGTLLRLEVADLRDTPVLGKRGGVYEETATISTDADVTDSLHETLSSALNKTGYRVVDDIKTPPLKIEIVALEYETETDKVTRIVKTHAAVNAAYSRDNRTYRNSYQVTRTKKMLTAPGMEENETLINETLAAALEQMLRDRDLFGLIE